MNSSNDSFIHHFLLFITTSIFFCLFAFLQSSFELCFIQSKKQIPLLDGQILRIRMYAKCLESFESTVMLDNVSLPDVCKVKQLILYRTDCIKARNF